MARGTVDTRGGHRPALDRRYNWPCCVWLCSASWRQAQAANTASGFMSDHTRFGIWTLVAAIGWIAGLTMAFIAIWKLWTNWYRM